MSNKYVVCPIIDPILKFEEGDELFHDPENIIEGFNEAKEHLRNILLDYLDKLDTLQYDDMFYELE